VSEFYHLDRTGMNLKPGMILDWLPVPPEITSDPEHEIWFPSGITRFGLDIILGKLEKPALEREHVLETFRRTHCPQLPSRYVALFACRSIDDMAVVRQQFYMPDFEGKRGRIWKIAATEIFRADMNLFKEHCGDMKTAAGRYWTQEATEEPLYEYLLEPPVTVLEEVIETNADLNQE
jgi:hypothetical protein